jgi:organic radical activating enzyme
MFDLHRLCDALHDGHTVQIETSGTEPIRAPEWAWITLSPKIAMPGGKTVLQEAVDLAREIKFPIGSIRDVEKLHQFLIDYRVPRDAQIWVQPLSQSAKATAICIDAAMAHELRGVARLARERPDAQVHWGALANVRQLDDRTHGPHRSEPGGPGRRFEPAHHGRRSV